MLIGCKYTMYSPPPPPKKKININKHSKIYWYLIFLEHNHKYTNIILGLAIFA